MKKIPGCALLLFTLLPVGRSAVVTISGKDTSYANQEIVFDKFADGITKSDEELAQCKVKPDGSFSFQFDISETTFVYAYLGIYRVHLYAEPGRTYDILLPPREDKEMKDVLNPYFSPVIVQLATTKYDENELNMLIRMFNDAFQPYYNKHIEDAAKRTDFTELDKDIPHMEKPFTASQNKFFNDYRRYRYAGRRSAGGP